MKKLFFLLLIMFPALAMAQGHKGEVDECAPMKNGKVCYRDTVHVNDMSQGPDIRSNQSMGEEKLCKRCIPVECQLQEVERDYQCFFQSRDAVE